MEKQIAGMAGSVKDITRGLVNSALEQFKAADNKKELIAIVEAQLSRHYRAVNAIGTGLADDYVHAGEVFLRLIRLYRIDGVIRFTLNIVTP